MCASLPLTAHNRINHRLPKSFYCVLSPLSACVTRISTTCFSIIRLCFLTLDTRTHTKTVQRRRQRQQQKSKIINFFPKNINKIYRYQFDIGIWSSIDLQLALREMRCRFLLCFNLVWSLDLPFEHIWFHNWCFLSFILLISLFSRAFATSIAYERTHARTHTSRKKIQSIQCENFRFIIEIWHLYCLLNNDFHFYIYSHDRNGILFLFLSLSLSILVKPSNYYLYHRLFSFLLLFISLYFVSIWCWLATFGQLNCTEKQRPPIV